MEIQIGKNRKTGKGVNFFRLIDYPQNDVRCSPRFGGSFWAIAGVSRRQLTPLRPLDTRAKRTWPTSSPSPPPNLYIYICVYIYIYTHGPPRYLYANPLRWYPQITPRNQPRDWGIRAVQTGGQPLLYLYVPLSHLIHVTLPLVPHLQTPDRVHTARRGAARTWEGRGEERSKDSGVFPGPRGGGASRGTRL